MLLQPLDAAIEDEHEELAAMYAAMGAEKSDVIAEEDEASEFPDVYAMEQ
jgi:hypothetical protein